MATAKDIADERLAKGEISKEEHADIIATIQKGDTSVGYSVSPSKQNFSWSAIGPIILGVMVAYFAMSGANYARQDGLPVNSGAVSMAFIIALALIGVGLYQMFKKK